MLAVDKEPGIGYVLFRQREHTDDHLTARGRIFTYGTPMSRVASQLLIRGQLDLARW